MKRIALLLGLVFSASAASAEGLMDIYRDALAQDATYSAARATYRAGIEKLPQARAGLLPAAAVSGNVRYNDAHGTINDSYRSNSLGISATQPIYRKENSETFQQAKHQVEIADAQLVLAGHDVILRVARAYFDVLLAQDTVDLSAAQKKAISEQLAQAKRNFEVGTATITDTHEAQARYDLTVAQEIAALNDLEIKNQALQTIIGRIPGKLDPLGDKLALRPPDPARMDDWVANAEASSYQVRVARAATEIARREIAKARAGVYPKLDATAGYSDSRNTLGGTFANINGEARVATVGLELSWPVWTSGFTDSRTRETIALHDKSKDDLNDTLRQVGLSTRQAFLGVTSGEAQVRALEQALTSSQAQLDSTKLGFEVGVRTSVDVLNAQQQFFSARRDLQRARYDYLFAGLQLKAQAGVLAEADLAEVAGFLTKAR